MNKIIRHFLRVSDLSFNEIQNLFERSALLKKQVDQKIFEQQLQNRTLILLFEKFLLDTPGIGSSPAE